MCANCGVTGATKPGDAKCALYCKDCSTPEKREKMKQENAEVQEEWNKNHGNK